MAELSAPLKLFAYTGREQGLMVIGSREAMAELSSQLSSTLNALPAHVPVEWPPELVAAAVQAGPYVDSQHWRVSFHVEGSVPSERMALACRSGSPLWLSLITAALAVVGFITLLRLVWNAF
ncbi:hypothetical protein [Methylibium sp.]|jgi:hypothetical protein|uniref:hypothetical protein n=1 Tax=Methylibium sp. TaxID=2067992 RepID=UPI003D0CB2B3